jgi:hypothetical protein
MAVSITNEKVLIFWDSQVGLDVLGLCRKNRAILAINGVIAHEVICLSRAVYGAE